MAPMASPAAQSASPCALRGVITAQSCGLICRGSHTSRSLAGLQEDKERLATKEGPERVRPLLGDWLPFLNTYRTMCLAPSPEFRLVLQQVRDLRLVA
jgi:hypothetical protein